MNKIVLFGLIGLCLMPLGYSALIDSLVFYDSFEGSNSSLTEYFGKILTINGNGIYKVSNGKLNQGLGFSGFSGSNATYNLKMSQIMWADSSPISMNFWWNTTAMPTAGDMVFYWGKAESTSRHGFVRSDVVNNTMFYGRFGGGNNDKAFFGGTAYAFNMITLVYNGTHANYYINGVLKATQAGDKLIADTINLTLGSYATPAQEPTGIIDELGIWNRTLTQTDIDELYNSGSGYSPININISDYNLTSIFDNSSSHLVEFNQSLSLNFTGYNSTGLTPQSITVNITSLGISQNFTSNVASSITFNNVSVNNYTILVYDPFNTSLNLTTYVTINDVDNITYSNSSKFFAVNSTKALNFTMYLDSGALSCNDYYNLTVPLLNITNRLVKSCDLTSVWFNNSNVYNYTAYLTNERFGRTINNTYNFYTNAYNLSTPTFNQTMANNTYTDIYWYLTTTPGYSSSGQNYTMAINFNGSTTYPTASVLNYSYIELKSTTKVVEALPFYLILNLTYGNESLLFNTSYSITLTTIQLDTCGTYTTKLLNISILDEEDLVTLVPNSTLVAYFNIAGALIPLTIINDTDGIIPICINNSASFFADVDFTFSANGWGATDKQSREHFFIDYYFNGSTVQQSFYKLETSFATKKTFTVYDSNEKLVENYYVRVKRWYGDGYKTVAMAKTNNNGLAITYARFYDYAYYSTEVLDPDGNKVYETEKNIFSTTDNILRISDEPITTYSDKFNGFEWDYEFSNTTKLFRYEVSSLESVDTDFYFKIYTLNGSLACSENSVTSSWIVYCNLTNYEGVLLAKGYTYDSSNNLISFFNYYFTNEESVYAWGNDGVIITMGVVLLMSLLGLGFNFYVAPLMGIIGLLFCRIFGLILISYEAIIALMFPAIIILLFFMRRNI